MNELKKYLTKEELEEIKALENSHEVKVGRKIENRRQWENRSPEYLARKKARAKLYRLRHLAKVGKAQLEGETK